jgi:hypothetical protein
MATIFTIFGVIYLKHTFVVISFLLLYIASILSGSLYYPDLLISQSVKLVDQGVYLPICGLYLALEGGLLVDKKLSNANSWREMHEENNWT